MKTESAIVAERAALAVRRAELLNEIAAYASQRPELLRSGRPAAEIVERDVDDARRQAEIDDLHERDIQLEAELDGIARDRAEDCWTAARAQVLELADNYVEAIRVADKKRTELSSFLHKLPAGFRKVCGVEKLPIPTAADAINVCGLLETFESGRRRRLREGVTFDAVPVKFLRPHLPYLELDIAAFPTSIAAALVSRGLCERVEVASRFGPGSIPGADRPPPRIPEVLRIAGGYDAKP